MAKKFSDLRAQMKPEARQSAEAAAQTMLAEMPLNEVALARQGTGMSQAEFAAALSISKRTLQEWEQGRRSPSGAAQALIRIASKHPDIVREALA